MKTLFMPKTYILVLAAIMYMSSCSKERIEGEKPQNKLQTDYANMDDFYNLNEPVEQTFIIDSLGGDTIVGMDGTKIWNVPKTIFMVKSTMQDIFYPFEIRLIEAYSIKNMILSRLPGLAQNNILQSAGEVKITAYKDNDELALKEYCGLGFWAPANPTVQGMELFYGFTNGTNSDFNADVLQTDYLFTHDNVTSVSVNNNGYTCKMAKLGWVNVGQKNIPTGTTTLTFTAVGSNTNFIDVYVVFNNLHNYVKVQNLSASHMPIGESITVFAIAKDAGGDFYYFKNDYVISSGLLIDLNMVQTTETQILSMMDGL